MALTRFCCWGLSNGSGSRRKVLQFQTRLGGKRKASSTTPTPSTSKTVLSGIQPTGIPHLGNYLGALSNWVHLQNTAQAEDRLFFSIVDLHALTVEPKPGDQPIARGTLEMAAALMAVGIDPGRSVIFCQSQVHQHAVMMWLLSCVLPIGKLNRMTTWKGKLVNSRNANSEDEVDESLLNVGLYTYPVLQAADILLYGVTHVPVGEDQKQHIELCRDLVELLNRRMRQSSSPHSLTFPQPMISSFKRILSLRDPSQKMSKSSPDPKSRILLTDPPAEIRKKIRSAVTDSLPGITYDTVTRPGVSNLLSILSGCTGQSVEDVSFLCTQKGMDHKALKESVCMAIEEKLSKPRDEFARLMEDERHISNILKTGSEVARKVASETLRKIQSSLGIWTP